VLHRYEPVRILCATEDVRASAVRALTAHAVDLTRCELYVVPTDRVWVRDSGPTGVIRDGRLEWMNWKFNAWAKYPNFQADELVGERIAELSGHPYVKPTRPDGSPLVLEGGGIEGNGAGVMLVTEEWLLSDTQVRNPGMTREEYEMVFREYLGITRTIWLGEGIVGDDTHGHVDDLARFVDRNTVVLAYEEDPADENHERTKDNLERLRRAAETFDGGLRIVTLPLPGPVIMDGERLPASYANFYIANGVVMVPTFNDPSDVKALNTLAELFPGREVVGIHSVDLIWGMGALHCLTQQQPKAPTTRTSR
jgi:agmatine deiminase